MDTTALPSIPENESNYNSYCTVKNIGGEKTLANWQITAFRQVFHQFLQFL